MQIAGASRADESMSRAGTMRRDGVPGPHAVADAAELLTAAAVDGHQVTVPGAAGHTGFRAACQILAAAGGTRAGLNRYEFSADAAAIVGELLSALGVQRPRPATPDRTPDPVAARMTDIAGDLTGKKVLVPWASTGTLARAAARRLAAVDCIEACEDLAAGLHASGLYHHVTCAGFAALTPEPGYDAVLAHPPFLLGDEVKHVLEAQRWLRPGGVIVALLPGNITSRTDAAASQLRVLADALGGRIEPSPDPAYRPPGYDGATVIVSFRRIASAPERREHPARPARRYAQAGLFLDSGITARAGGSGRHGLNGRKHSMRATARWTTWPGPHPVSTDGRPARFRRRPACTDGDPGDAEPVPMARRAPASGSGADGRKYPTTRLETGEPGEDGRRCAVEPAEHDDYDCLNDDIREDLSIAVRPRRPGSVRVHREVTDDRRVVPTGRGQVIAGERRAHRAAVRSPASSRRPRRPPHQSSAAVMRHGHRMGCVSPGQCRCRRMPIAALIHDPGGSPIAGPGISATGHPTSPVNLRAGL